MTDRYESMKIDETVSILREDLIERLRNFEGSDALGNGDFSLLHEAAAALEAAREDAEAARTAITTAPKCRLLEVQSLGFDDPDRPVLEWMIKSGKRFRIVDDAAIDAAMAKDGGGA